MGAQVGLELEELLQVQVLGRGAFAWFAIYCTALGLGALAFS